MTQTKSSCCIQIVSIKNCDVGLLLSSIMFIFAAEKVLINSFGTGVWI